MERKEAIAVLECLALEMNAILAGIPKSEVTADQIKRYIDAYGMAISALRQQDHFRDLTKKVEPLTNAQKIRSMSDEELAEFLTHINPTNCQDCAFSHGWRCQPDRDDYSDFEKCKEGRKRWLKQPAE